jgi:hypothetical protein
MFTKRKNGRLRPRTGLELSGGDIRRREQQDDAADPYDTGKCFAGIRPPIELFRRQRNDESSDEPVEREKRIKFEIVDDTRPQAMHDGYNPYDTDRRR